jgi:hypothetical protein
VGALVEVTTFTDILVNQPLTEGDHEHPEKGTCVMEKVCILWAVAMGRTPYQVFTDLPPCTNPLIARAAQIINDSVDERNRQRLNLLIPRLLRARNTDSDHRIELRLVQWLLLRAAAQAEDETREACEAVARDIQRRLDGERLRGPAPVAFDHRLPDYQCLASKAARVVRAGSGVQARAAAHIFLSTALEMESISTLDRDDVDLIGLLDELLDAWEEAVTKEGEDLYVPQAWEDEALAFVAEYMIPGGSVK